MNPSRMASVCLACIMVASVLFGPGTMPARGADGSFGGGDGTLADPYVIEDVFDLQNMSGNLGAHYVLGNDIDASATATWDSGEGFTPMGAPGAGLTGSLDGKGHTITGLFIARDTQTFVGLFGGVDAGGSVKNVRLAECDVTGSANVGGLVGYNLGTVSLCHATGEVAAIGEYAGGLVGCNSHGTVSGSHATVNVTGMSHVGGLVGSNSHGNVSGSHATGGAAGQTGVGALVGTNLYATVSTSYASGKATGSGMYVGGLVGVNGAPSGGDRGTVSDSYATGNVTGGSLVGGLVGFNRGAVSRSYSTGNATGAIQVGGLVGYSDYLHSNVSNSLWDMETSGLGSSSGGTGRTTAGMRARSTFTDEGWDFTSTWFIIESVTYPCLRWQDAQPPTADAGPDRTVTLGPDGKVELAFDVTASTDDFGHLNHTWSIDYDGSEVVLYGTTVEFTFERPGTFDVTLTVTDSTGNTGTDTMTVTASDVTPPVADAGPDQTVDQRTMVTFDGSGSSDNVGVVDCTWTFMDGAPVTLHGDRPGYRFDNAGVFAVTLNATDAAGGRGTDAMTVTVNDTTPPLADAGPDLTVPVGSTVALNGSLAADNVGVTGHAWNLTYDGQARTLDGEVVPFTFGVAGVYEVVLTVADLAGNSDEDAVIITVVGTGRVVGTVLDERGRPVEGAAVVVTASDGKAYTASTAANGSFAVEVHHGPFTWAISKDGHGALTGTSSVDAMGTTVLDLSDTPLVREDEGTPSILLFSMLVIVIVAVAIVIALLLRRRRGKGESDRQGMDRVGSGNGEEKEK